MHMPATESSPARRARSAADIRQWLISELSRLLNVDPSTIDTGQALHSLGVDSLGAIGLTGALASWLNRDLPASLMWDYASIDAMAQGLADGQQTARLVRGIVELQPHGDRCPIFLFPGIKGHPVTFEPMAEHLGPMQPSFGLTVPGLDGEEEPLQSIEEIAARMLESIRRVQAKGPYQLAGYSFGGMLAYEVAQQLTARGEQVSMLAIYDSFTPQGRTVRPRWQRLALHAYLIIARPGRAAYLIQRYKQLRVDRRAEMALAEAAARGTVERSTIVAKNLETANAQAAMRYQPRPYPGSVLLFRAGQREIHNIFYYLDASNGWGAVARGGVKVFDIPQTHIKMLDAEVAALAAEMLRPYLADPVL